MLYRSSKYRLSLENDITKYFYRQAGILLFVKLYRTWSDLLLGGSLIARRSIFWISKVFIMIDGRVVLGTFPWVVTQAAEWEEMLWGLVPSAPGWHCFSSLLTALQDVHNVPQNKDILLSSRYQPPFRAFTMPREENRPGFSRGCEEHKHSHYYAGTTKQVPCLSTANTSYKLQGVHVMSVCPPEQYKHDGIFLTNVNLSHFPDFQSLHPRDVSLPYGRKLHTCCTCGDRQVSFGVLSCFSRKVSMKTRSPKKDVMVLRTLSLINKL